VEYTAPCFSVKWGDGVSRERACSLFFGPTLSKPIIAAAQYELN